ncbi:MAG: FIST N-terminal domain-containing protein [Sulfuricella sp.]|nr:FIST N-terminal domain-containing protein [Sulfuricella sp.]
MKVEQRLWTQSDGWQPDEVTNLGDSARLLLIFGSTGLLADANRYNELRASYPQAIFLGCSTAGEICGTRVLDDSLVATAVSFDHTQLKLASVAIDQAGASRAAGEALARQLDPAGLAHVLVISDGLKVNGTDLVDGLKAVLPEHVAVTGGLSGDGALFRHTLVCADAPAIEGQIAALGFYGDRIKIGYGSLGGWDPFGPDRLITKSRGNVLYELDGQSALELYKSYLGEHAAGLPSTGLLFPLALHGESGQETGLVRTILAVNETDQSMTFAGDMPEGVYAQLMKANFDRLIEGAANAARATSLGAAEPELAILISCVGRKLVLKQRVEEEVEGVRDVLGAGTVLAGFYSYGEISPYAATAKCELHNQTMTITTFSEA